MQHNREMSIERNETEIDNSSRYGCYGFCHFTYLLFNTTEKITFSHCSPLSAFSNSEIFIKTIVQIVQSVSRILDSPPVGTNSNDRTRSIMDLLRKKFFALAIIFYCNVHRTSAQNSTVVVQPLKYHIPIIPIITTNILGSPKKFERIVVPVDIPKHHINEKKKPVSEKRREKEPEEKKVKSTPVKEKINSKNYNDGKGNSYKSYSYVRRDDDHGKIPTDTTPNDIQPLHITTRGYKAPQPETATEPVHEKKKKAKELHAKLKLDNLPENPYRVPETNWWDNIGKYNYGIIHDDFKGLEAIPTAEDAKEVESKEMVTPAVVVEPVTQVVHHHEPSFSPVKFKSSFKNPNQQAQDHRSDNPGRFLYKTQVYYPNYRDHLYLPVTTYYGQHQGLAKVFPVFNSHTVHHNSPHNSIHHSTSPSPPEIYKKAPIPAPIPKPKRPSEKPLPSPPTKESEEEEEESEDYDDGEGENEGEAEDGEWSMLTFVFCQFLTVFLQKHFNARRR
jgi:hypothetical protein